MEEKIICHIDMDAFFAAVEERERPWLKGMPIAVGSDPKGGLGRGVLSTANYKAREYGLRSALPITKAWEFSQKAKKEGKPEVVFIQPSSRKYSTVSKEVFSIVRNYTDILVVASIDEAYFDLTHVGSYQKAEKVCKKIKNEIHTKTKLTASIGIAPTKMLAKIASDFNKPNGLTVVTEKDAYDFLEPLQISKIPGVGKKSAQQLHQKNIYTIQDARKLSWSELSHVFGSRGFDIYQKIRGSGSTNELLEAPERKSIGQHRTFNEDTLDMEFVFAGLERMAEEIFEQLHSRTHVGFFTTVLTIRFSDFETKTKSLTTKEMITSSKKMTLRAIKLALPFFDMSENKNKKAIRMIGLRAEKLV